MKNTVEIKRSYGFSPSLEQRQDVNTGKGYISEYDYQLLRTYAIKLREQRNLWIDEVCGNSEVAQEAKDTQDLELVDELNKYANFKQERQGEPKKDVAKFTE